MAETRSEIMRGLIQPIMDQESDFRPDAISEDGAVGLMQVMPEYAFQYGYGVPSLAVLAEEMGFDVPAETTDAAHQLLLDPELNERMGTEILRGLLKDQDGNLREALTAYNMGAPDYKKWRAAGADPKKLDKEARNYASGVFENYRRMYGRELPEFFPLATPRARPAGLLTQ